MRHTPMPSTNTQDLTHTHTLLTVNQLSMEQLFVPKTLLKPKHNHTSIHCFPSGVNKAPILYIQTVVRQKRGTQTHTQL